MPRSPNSSLPDFLRWFGTSPPVRQAHDDSAIDIDKYETIEEETLPHYRASNFYPVRLNDDFSGRYEVSVKLGYGASSTVWLARDRRVWSWFRSPYVILKVLTANFSDRRLENMEMAVSDLILGKRSSHGGVKYLRTAKDRFTLERQERLHTVLVYQPMRETISTFQLRCLNSRLSEIVLKFMVKFLLEGLDFLHSECHVIHTDLKPDNIMIDVESRAVLEEVVLAEQQHPVPFKVREDRNIYCRRNLGPIRGTAGRPKIADFGHAMWDKGKPYYHDIQPNLFKAPEVILEAGWSCSADIWNLGALIWDLMENRTLFTSQYEDGRYTPNAHLAQMISLLGPPPQALLDRGRATSKHFNADGLLDSGIVPPHGLKTLEDAVTTLHEPVAKAEFLAFARRILTWLPEERATAAQLLRDPWLAGID